MLVRLPPDSKDNLDTVLRHEWYDFADLACVALGGRYGYQPPKNAEP